MGDQTYMGGEDCSCKCGNILISGHVLEPCYLPNIPGAERVRFSGCVSCMIIREQAITVADKAALTLRKQSDICTDLICQKCNTTFRVFLNHPWCFIGLVQAAPRSHSAHVSMRKSVPKRVFHLIRFATSNEAKLSDSDDDFEMMFGNRTMPLVGSCLCPFGSDTVAQSCST